MGGVREIFEDGVAAAGPICLGYVPIGLAFGVLARQAGLAPWQAALLSVVVFAGSSQFIAVSLLSGGASLATLAATTFVVNLRHALMGSALSLYLRGAGGRFLALFAHGITDESFAVNLARFRSGTWDRRRALVVNGTTCAAWTASAAAGARLGQLVPRGAAGVDYALPAMFLCLLVTQLRRPIHGVVALVSALLSLGFTVGGAGDATVLAASLAGATAGFALLGARRRRKPGP